MQRLLANLRHLPSTLAGGVVIATGAILTATSNPLLAQLAGMNPISAKYFTAIATVAAGLGLMFGVGPAKAE